LPPWASAPAAKETEVRRLDGLPDGVGHRRTDDQEGGEVEQRRPDHGHPRSQHVGRDDVGVGEIVKPLVKSNSTARAMRPINAAVVTSMRPGYPRASRALAGWRQPR
jgi:hypothetical protein